MFLELGSRVMPGVPFTPREDRTIIANWGKILASAIAKKLGRNVRSIYNHAYRLGVGVKHDKKAIAKRKAKMVALHAKGYSGQEIADGVGLTRRTVQQHLTRMGLSANGRNERYRKRVAKRTKQQCRDAGVKNLAEVKALEVRKLASALGWPDHLSLRALQIVELLYVRGPMTRKQIAAAIGMRWMGSRKTFSNSRVPGGSYMAELLQAGLLVRLQSAITHKGKGNHEDVYMVGLEIEPCQIARSKSQLKRLKTQLNEKPERSQCKEN